MSQLDQLYVEFQKYNERQQADKKFVGLTIYGDGSGLIEITSYNFRSEYMDIHREIPVRFDTMADGIQKLEKLNELSTNHNSDDNLLPAR